VAFSLDGDLLATAGEHGPVQMWGWSLGSTRARAVSGTSNMRLLNILERHLFISLHRWRSHVVACLLLVGGAVTAGVRSAVRRGSDLVSGSRVGPMSCSEMGYRASPNEVTSRSVVDALRHKDLAYGAVVTPFDEAL
jgi:hypothetical protein